MTNAIANHTVTWQVHQSGSESPIKLIRSFAVSLPMAGIGGVATAAQLATANPPLGFPTSAEWLWSAPNPWLLITAAFSALGAVSAIQSFFQPKPYTAKQGRDDRAHQNQSFAAADERQQSRHEELLEKIASLEAAIGRSNPQAAGPFGEALTELAESDDVADVAIAQTAVDQSPELAADALVAEATEGKLRNAERFRQAARLYAPSAPGKAKAAYEDAVALDPTDFWSWIELGRLRMVYDSLDSAELALKNGLQRVTDERGRSVLHTEFGQLLLARGDLSNARVEFEAALKTDESFVKAEPGNAEWQRDLSISYDNLGEVEATAGNLGAARTRFEQSLAIAERLAAADPGNVGWQRDLSVSYNKLGDVEVAAGNLGAARTRFEQSLNIRERLAEAESGNAEWQRDLSVSYNKLGDIEAKAGNLDAARTRFEQSLAITERLAKAEPGNAEWQRDLSVSYELLGDVEATAGNLDAARTRFEQSLAIAERLAAADPGNAGWQRDLWASNGRLGELAEAEGNLAGALAHFRAAEAVMAELLAKWPDHPGFARDLVAVRGSIAGLEGGGGG